MAMYPSKISSYQKLMFAFATKSPPSLNLLSQHNFILNFVSFYIFTHFFHSLVLRVPASR